MVFIIAEAGVNHCGRLDHAFALIRAAKDAGADAVKFQGFTPERLAPDNYERRAMLKSLALTEAELIMCAAETEHAGMEFMCTAFDDEWLKWLLSRKMIKRIKIGSGQVLDHAANRDMWSVADASGLPVIISNGLAFEQDVQRCIDGVGGVMRTTVLSCISRYPTPETDVALAELEECRSRYGACKIGFSSHCRSFWPSVAAVYVGAEVVECHVTLPGLKSPDQTSSIYPDELRAMVREIRYAERVRGTVVADR